MHTKIYIISILFFNTLVKSEDYEDNSAVDYESASEDSESNERHVVSLQDMPVRQRNILEELKNNFIDGNITIDIMSPCKKFNSKNHDLLNDNGKYTRLNEYPYSTSIQKKGSHYATGALVHKKWILTVAREFYNIRESIKLFKARLGSVNCKRGGTLVPLKGIEIHPSYVYNRPGFDLAMLRIGHTLQCSDIIRPISFSTVKGFILNAKFLATYWSRLIINGKILAHSAKARMKQYSMRVSTQKMIPWNKCFNIMQTYNLTLDATSACLEPIVFHHNPCMPDVGAPVIAEDGLWGITSGWTSDNCPAPLSPIFFSRVSLEPIAFWLDSLLNYKIKK